MFKLLNTIQNADKLFKEEQLKFVCFFQEYCWDGYSDENDPKFITREDFEAIEALSDKIFHMTFNIGSPCSVIGMLSSIAEGTLKRWQADNTLETPDEKRYDYDKEAGKTIVTIRRGFRKGKQLRTKDELRQVWNSKGYYGRRGNVLVGHFRWNNRGYILSRRCREILTYYIVNNLEL